MPELFPWFLQLHVLGTIIAFEPTFAFPIIGAIGWQGADARQLRDPRLALGQRSARRARSDIDGRHRRGLDLVGWDRSLRAGMIERVGPAT